MLNAKKVKDEIVQWIRDWFEENGPGCNAVIGISGGKDSTVVAALCCEALGKDRVIGVMMPDGEQADIDKSYEVVKHLGIRSMEVNIGGATTSIISNTDYAITVKWENRVRRLAKECGYDSEFLIARFEEVMDEDGDIDYFVGVTMEHDW